MGISDFMNSVMANFSNALIPSALINQEWLMGFTPNVQLMYLNMNYERNKTNRFCKYYSYFDYFLLRLLNSSAFVHQEKQKTFNLIYFRILLGISLHNLAKIGLWGKQNPRNLFH